MIRKARLDDVPAIRTLINSHAELGAMLFRSLADLYDSLRDFVVYQQDDRIIGCCALTIIWSDLAEVRSLAVRPESLGQGIGSALVQAVIEEARQLKLPGLFTLTLKPDFFTRLGFTSVDKDTLPMKVWSDCIRCPKQDHCDEIALTLPIS